MTLKAEPLTAEAFAPYGDVLVAPTSGRTDFGETLVTLRPHARPSLAIALVPPADGVTLKATRMERHEFTSQSFIPLDVSRYLIFVAPKTAEGKPDIAKARAFIAGPGQGITYRHDTWHHPMVTLDRPAQFAVYMWRDDKTDDEFVDITPTVIEIPA